MENLEALAREYAGRRLALRSLLLDLEAEVSRARGKAMRGIKSAIERTSASRAALLQSVTDSPELFERPKTVVVDGVRFGWIKQRGTVTFEDKEAVCERIRKRLPELADALIAVEESPRKSALMQLTGAQIKAIGASVTEDCDAPVVKDIDTDVDKLVAALIGKDEAE